MKILFIGQLGLAASMGSQKTARQQRIERLGRALISQGHQVIVIGTYPYHNATVTNYHGIELARHWSLNPQQPGGWLYLVLSLVTLWRQQPDVVHMHGWQTATLAWLAALLCPETTFIWTIDTLPTRYWWLAKKVVQLSARVVDSVTVPSRTLQYLVLHHFNLPTTYIPDGYTTATVKDLPLRTWGLRREQYCLLLAQSDATIRAGVRAYIASKNRKKLVILADAIPKGLRLGSAQSLLRPVGNLQGRRLRTLVRGASSVIATENWPYLDTLLLAMDSGRNIIAANTPLYQETLGVTAQYYRMGNRHDLSNLLRSASTPRLAAKAWGTKAKKRARLFTWDNIIPEYLAAYRYQAVHYIPVDSARELSPISLRVTR